MHKSIEKHIVYRSVQVEFHKVVMKDRWALIRFSVKSRDQAKCGCGLPYYNEPSVHYVGLFIKSNHNENILLLREGGLRYSKVSKR